MTLAKILGVGREKGEVEKESRSLADLHVALLEENASALNSLAELSDVANKEKSWNQEKLHKRLASGSLIRVTAPTQIIDPSTFSGLVEKYDQLSDDSQFSEMVSSLVDAMYGDDIVLRVLPCGVEKPKFQFSGTITDPGNYMKGERGSLFSRLGADGQDWTTLATVSRIPRRGGDFSLSSLERAMAQVDEQFREMEDGKIERGVMEYLIQEMWRFLEVSGLTEAPTWPSISIIPLAIYRHLPTADNFNDFS